MCSTLFCTFVFTTLIFTVFHNHDLKLPNIMFYGGRELKTRIFFSFSELKSVQLSWLQKKFFSILSLNFVCFIQRKNLS